IPCHGRGSTRITQTCTPQLILAKQPQATHIGYAPLRAPASRPRSAIGSGRGCRCHIGIASACGGVAPFAVSDGPVNTSPAGTGAADASVPGTHGRRRLLPGQTAAAGGHRGSGLPGARRRRRERRAPPAGLRRPGSAEVLADDEQARVLAPAERAGEGATVQVDRGQHLAALAHPHALLVTHVGVPDSALGIDADPVWVIAWRLRPHPPAAEAAVRADGVCLETARVLIISIQS